MSKQWNIRKTYQSEYSALKNAIHRCHNEESTFFDDYGGRGITVAPEFRGPNGFFNFFLEIGPKPTPDHTLERLDNNDGYRPGNIAWRTRKEQIANRRPRRPTKDLGWGFGEVMVRGSHGSLQKRRSPLIPWAGETMTLHEWARRLGLERATLRQRFQKNWPLERCMASHLWSPGGEIRRKQPEGEPQAEEIAQECIELLDEAILDITGRRH